MHNTEETKKPDSASAFAKMLNNGLDFSLMQQFIQGIEYFRSLDPNNDKIPMQYLLILFLIAVHNMAGERIELMDLHKITGMEVSSVSRAISYWTKLGRAGKSGYGLVSQEVDPLDKRRKPLRLTLKGTKTLATFCQLMGMPLKGEDNNAEEN